MTKPVTYGECSCDCHHPLFGAQVKHIMPCCEPCPYCGARIAHSMKCHMDNCSYNPEVIRRAVLREEPEG